MSSEYANEFNEFLEDEMSAVKSYDIALDKQVNSVHKEALGECRQAHAELVKKLRSCVSQLSGTPKKDAGIFGGFNVAVEDRAATPTDAIALLEQAEAERLVRYEAQRKIVPPPVLSVLENELLPSQHKTHLTVSALLKEITPLPRQ